MYFDTFFTPVPPFFTVKVNVYNIIILMHKPYIVLFCYYFLVITLFSANHKQKLSRVAVGCMKRLRQKQEVDVASEDNLADRA